MSGRTIGTVAGAVIGFYLGGPQGAYWGAMIGGMAGGIISPDKLQGVQLDDVPGTTSVSGNPIAIVMGSSVVKGTRVICQSEVRIVTEEEQQGKGGPVVENDVAYQDFTIEVCESSELRGTSVEGIVAVWEDGILVYDVRPTPLISAADSAKWKNGVTFYYGLESQMPDPTEESIYGVGNVPAYRGKCRMVFANRKISPRNSIPNFEVLVSKCGVDGNDAIIRWLGSGQSPSGILPIARPLGFDGGWVGDLDAAISSDSTGGASGVVRYGDKMFAVLSNNTVRVSDLSDLSVWVDGPSGLNTGFGSGSAVLACGRMWVVCWEEGLSYISDPDAASFTSVSQFGGTAIRGISGDNTSAIAVNTYAAFFSSTDSGDNWTPAADIFDPDNFYTDFGALDTEGGNRYVIGGRASGFLRAYFTDDLAETFTACSVPTVANVAPTQVKYCGNNHWLLACTADGGGTPTESNRLFLSTDNGETFDAVTLPDVVTFDQQYSQSIAVDSLTGRVVIAGTEDITGERKFYYTDDFMSWVPVDMAGTEVGSIHEVYPLSYTTSVSGTELPDAPGYFVQANGSITGPSVGEAEMCGVTLDEVVSLITRLRDIPISELDATELESVTVRGITIQSHDSGRDILQPIQQTWLFDLPEFDSKLRAHRRGQDAVDFVIPDGDLLDTDDEDEDWRRRQMVEFPRRHYFGFMSLDLDYVVTESPAERTSPDVRVVGDSHIAGVGVHNAQEAAQIADIQMKVLWTEREGARKFGLPLEYIGIVGASLITLGNRRWRIDDYRIDAGAIYIEAALHDRKSAYSSTVEGATPNPPVPPPSTLLGPTVGFVLNTSGLRLEDDTIGVYVGACGLLEGWQGYAVELSRDGGTTWTNVIAANGHAATTGTLTAELPVADRDTTDETNTLSVLLQSGELNSITHLAMHNGGNAAAILYADGTAEVVNFQTATEAAPMEYALTTLLRGRVDTTIATHAIGARFALLDNSLRFIPLKASDLGQTLTFRFVTLGTDPAANESQDITISEFESQREWSITNLSASRDGSDNVTVAWDGRPCLGTNVQPVHHAAFIGYRVEYTSGATTIRKDIARTPMVIVGGIIDTDEVTTHTYTAAEQTTDFGSVPGSLDITVSAVNSYTGAGPTESISA